MVAQLVTPWQLLSRMRYVSLINMTNLAFPSHGSLHPQLGVFVYMSGLLSTTHGLQIAFYVPHTYSYQHMNFPTTLQHKKTQLIINSSNDIISDLVFFNYFLTPQQIPIASVILFLLQQTHPISCLIFLLKTNRSNLLAHSFLLFCYSLQQTHPISCFIFWLKRDRSHLLAHSFINLLSVGSNCFF
jgi:hypothetical protein